MERMGLWQPWILLALIYAAALVISIKKLKFMGGNEDEENYSRNSMIFSLAILGARNIFIFSRKKSSRFISFCKLSRYYANWNIFR